MATRWNDTMKKSQALILFSSFLSMSGHAAESKLELLAGIEAGIDSDTAMTVSDLSRTQEILSSERTGTVKTWYNLDSTTFYDVKVGKHFTADQRPCIAYTLTTKHNSKTESQKLTACMNHDGQWISTDLNSYAL
jgi:surface antigen